MIDRAREIGRRAKAAKTYEERQYWLMVLDTAVDDIRDSESPPTDLWAIPIAFLVIGGLVLLVGLVG